MSKIVPMTAPDIATQVQAVFERGDLVVLPTETVYGVACNPYNAAAVEAIYAAKQRPTTKALQIMLADVDDALKIATGFPTAARKLADAFMPGPLTITLPKKASLPLGISPYPTVGVRIPDDEPLRAVIRALGGVIAITSANISGGTSPTTVAMAAEQLGDAVALYVDGGPSRLALSSTVVETTLGDEVKILREGPITLEQIEAALA